MTPESKDRVASVEKIEKPGTIATNKVKTPRENKSADKQKQPKSGDKKIPKDTKADVTKPSKKDQKVDVPKS